MLLSAAAPPVMHPDYIIRPNVTTGIMGYSPGQIKSAYGFDQVSLSGGATPDGTGQTIAIVDAFDDPNIVSDLATFDSQFGLPAPPSFRVVNQTGGSSLPQPDAGWAGEISLDVEWSHAIAPGANILLVEATTNSNSDLVAATDYARHAAGVSVVSMSWGGSEFFSFNGFEFDSQTAFDPTFTTPSGHQGVTFVVASGDSGAFSGAQWPSSSPNVLAVGGTSLLINATTEAYQSESPWDGTAGGYSGVEPKPAYQDVAQATALRSTPDVSYDGDPVTGFAIYDSFESVPGLTSWVDIGGTSAGAPQWSALLAIANQGRALAGLGSLDGVSQTLPLLYGLYSPPGTVGYLTYSTTFFHDVTGSLTPGRQAVPGYDTATGLGSPRAPAVIDALVGAPAVGTSGPVTPSAQIVGAFKGNPPVSVIGGTTGSVTLHLTNTGTSRFKGPIAVTVYASAQDSLTGGIALGTISVPKLSLGAGASRTLRLRFTYPTSLATGTYYLVAAVTETGTNTVPSVTVNPATVTITAPAVDLAVAFSGIQPLALNGSNSDAIITVTNLGNVIANGTVNLNLYASATGVLNVAVDPLLATLSGVPVHLRPGRFLRMRVHFAAPAAGLTDLIASITSSTTPADNNPANNTAVATTTG